MQKNKVIILATEGLTTNLLCESLQRDFDILQIIIENKESNWKKIKRRFKKLSFFNVISQLMFLILILPFLKRKAKKRIEEIVRLHGFKNKIIETNKFTKIESINDEEILEIIKKKNPDCIFLNGTRIVSEKILKQITIPIVNIHVGTTPKYRGIHGGYWALYNNDLENFGVTLHFVDTGVDTGKIIAQSKFSPSVDDNFYSYPVLQFVEGLKLIKENRESFLNSDLIKNTELNAESKQYYHPGFFQYLFKRWRKGVK